MFAPAASSSTWNRWQGSCATEVIVPPRAQGEARHESVQAILIRPCFLGRCRRWARRRPGSWRAIRGTGCRCCSRSPPPRRLASLRPQKREAAPGSSLAAARAVKTPPLLPKARQTWRQTRQTRQRRAQQQGTQRMQQKGWRKQRRLAAAWRRMLAAGHGAPT